MPHFSPLSFFFSSLTVPKLKGIAFFFFFFFFRAQQWAFSGGKEINKPSQSVGRRCSLHLIGQVFSRRHHHRVLNSPRVQQSFQGKQFLEGPFFPAAEIKNFLPLPHISRLFSSSFGFTFPREKNEPGISPFSFHSVRDFWGEDVEEGTSNLKKRRF